MTKTKRAEIALTRRYCSTCQMFYPYEQRRHDCEVKLCACGCGTTLRRSRNGRRTPDWARGHSKRARESAERDRYYVTSLSGYDGGQSGKRALQTDFYVLDRFDCHRAVAHYGPHSASAKVNAARIAARQEAEHRNELEREWEAGHPATISR